MGEGSDASIRGQEALSPGKDSLAKMSQVIQVCRRPRAWTATAVGLPLAIADPNLFLKELLHESCIDHPSCKIFPAACLRQRFRD